jgi:hypothetical protein
MTLAQQKYNRISSDAVKAKTGRGWTEWFKILDKAGGKKRDHKSIVKIVSDNGAGSWWQQMITVGYEQARGLRVKHQTAAGFSVSVTRTLPVEIKRLFAAWTDDALRRKWLKEPITIRKAAANRSLRIAFNSDATNVDVGFFRKPTGTQISVEHRKLKDAAAVEKMRRFWKQRLNRIAGD